MTNPVTTTAVCTCSFGALPIMLPVTSQNTVLMCNLLAATIMDNKCTSFGMCSCPNNPAVMAATSAAMGVLTPSACTPVTLTPWAPGVPKILICGKPLLQDSSKLNCFYGGVITVSLTPAKTIQTP